MSKRFSSLKECLKVSTSLDWINGEVFVVREKEYHGLILVQQSQNSAKEKEVQALYSHLKAIRAKIDKSKAKGLNAQFHTIGFDKVNELESKLKDAEKRHSNFQIEVSSMHRIQTEQTKALSEIGNHKNYPEKIRDLIIEMRDYKDKNKVLEDKLKLYEDQKKRAYQEMLELEDRCKDLKQRINGY